LLYDVRMVGIG